MTEGDKHQHVLAQRACDGDQVALKVLLAQSRRQLCRYVLLSTPRDLAHLIDPEDVVQEAYIVVFKKLETLRSKQPAAFQRWLRAVALSKLRFALRWHRATKRGGGARVSPRKRSIEDSTIALLTMLARSESTPSRAATRAEAVTALHSAMDQLPRHYREAVRLVYIEDVPVEQVAAQMARTERAVHALCRRGLKRLEQELGSRSRFLSPSG